MASCRQLFGSTASEVQPPDNFQTIDLIEPCMEILPIPAIQPSRVSHRAVLELAKWRRSKDHPRYSDVKAKYLIRISLPFLCLVLVIAAEAWTSPSRPASSRIDTPQIHDTARAGNVEVVS